MDGLRPERDELDRFQSRSQPAKTKKPKSSKPPVKTKGAPSATRSNTPVLLFSFTLTLVLFGFLAWAYLKQNETITQLNADLGEAMEFINQSKLSMARFEGELSTAGAELEEAGSAAEKQLKFLDSEMRKLWGLAGDRNRKAISENKDTITGVGIRLNELRDGRVADLDAQLKTQSALVGEMSRMLETETASKKDVKTLQQQLANSQSEVALTREVFEDRLNDLEEKFQGIPDNVKEVGENAKAIASIDASRRQLNERIVGLERRLNELKLQVSSGTAP